MGRSALAIILSAEMVLSCCRCDAGELSWDTAEVRGRLSRENPFFLPGEEMRFTLALEGVDGGLPTNTYYLDWERRGDDGKVERGREPLPLPNNSFSIATSMDKPGFVSVEANVVTADGKKVPKKHRWEKRVFFMGGAAVEPWKLQSAVDPADFDEFWKEVRTSLDELPMDVQEMRLCQTTNKVDVFALKVACPGPRPMTGYLAVPQAAGEGVKFPAHVIFDGAGTNPQQVPKNLRDDQIVLRVNTQGYELGRDKEYYEKFFRSVCPHGCPYDRCQERNRNRRTAFVCHMAMRAIRAVDFISTFESGNGIVIVEGGSQGGFQAAIAATQARRTPNRLKIDIPWGLDWSGITLGRQPSYYRPTQKYEPELDYFDPCLHARRIKCPVEISKVGLGDYCSPPSSATVFYNNLKVPRVIRYVQGSTHGWWPKGMQEYAVTNDDLSVVSVRKDMMTAAALKDVRLEGWFGAKMDRFISQRFCDAFQRKEIFDEARQAFAARDDDESGVGGLWRGEFWGKQMLGSARIAEYLQDGEFLDFIREECHRLVALQDPDGYLGSYADKTFVKVRDVDGCMKRFGWLPNWNLWNRKYCMWGMLAAYKATGDRGILASVEAQMNQWIDMMHGLGVPLSETGAGGMNGMPPMSVLKPLLLLYKETGTDKYLKYAKEIVMSWNREDGRAPNFIKNSQSGKALHTWYPEPEKWAKSYEMMSCLDGMLEYYRAAGDAMCLDTVVAIRDLLWKYERNPLGGVGFGDKFIGAASYPNGLSEVCDAIHWIRLNVDLFLITGDDRYMDAVELCYYNNFFAGVDRDGRNGSFMVRAMQCHEHQPQCGYAHNHCCVNNIPRSFMDFASVVVTKDRRGTYHVNQYQDATVTLDGVKFVIRGGYPANGRVEVSVDGKPQEVVFRRPAWCKKLDVEKSGSCYVLTFDMDPRWEHVAQVPNMQSSEGLRAAEKWALNRYGVAWQNDVNKYIRDAYRKTPAPTLWRGPLLLAKSRRLGMKSGDAMLTIADAGKSQPTMLIRVNDSAVMCAWEVRLPCADGKETVSRVCDYQSAADAELSGCWFSIWF